MTTAPVSRWSVIVSVLTLSLWLAACEPLGMTLFGLGANSGVSHTLNGIVSKTFTEPLPRVRQAALTALKRMAIRVEAWEQTEHGEILRASTPERDIEIEFETISAKATRMRAQARQQPLLMDAATATEIITQTERALATGA